MKKKGFTLIELLAVIILIGLISLIVIPISIRVIDDVRSNTVEVHEKMMIKAAKDYIVMYGSEIPSLDTTGGRYYLSYEELLDEGLIEGNMTDPLTGEAFDYTDDIRITKLANGTYQYDLYYQG